MDFALVSFAFNGGFFNEKKYLFKTEVKGLVKGDVVVVEGRNEGETTLAVFSKYVDEDLFPQQRKVLLKKAHKNTLKSVMKKQVELFKDVTIAKGMCNQYRILFKNNETLSDDEIRIKIIRNLSVAAQRFSPHKNTYRYFFGTMQLVLKDGVLCNLTQHKQNVVWIRPNLLDELAEQYLLEQLVTN